MTRAGTGDAKTENIENRTSIFDTQSRISARLEAYLEDDIGREDITSGLLPRGKVKALLFTKHKCPITVAGTEYARMIFESRGCSCAIRMPDGTKAIRNDTILAIAGEAKSILECERTALNMLSRMSGIATATAGLVAKLPGIPIYATRKTAPGLRKFDKDAVEIGGGNRHRMRLDEAVMIKDNHIAAARALSHAKDDTDAIRMLVEKAKTAYGEVEVEVENADQAVAAVRAGATTIMLDNFDPDGAKDAITRLKECGLRDNARIEISGGITEENIQEYAASGADLISAGFLTNAVAGVDMSLAVQTTMPCPDRPV